MARLRNPVVRRFYVDLKQTPRWAFLLLLAGGFFWLGFSLVDWLPCSVMPREWAALWPTRTIAIIAWLNALMVVGTLILAIPCAILMKWILVAPTPQQGLVVTGPAALWACWGLVEYSDTGGNLYLPAMASGVFAALVTLTSVPLLVWVIAHGVGRPWSKVPDGPN